VASFLAWLEKEETWRELSPGVALQGLCGLRLREAWRLRCERVDLERGFITVDGVVKNLSSVRRLPLPNLVLSLLGSVPHDGDRVLAAYEDQTSYAKAIGRCLRKVFPGRKIEPKGLRRTLPTEAIREGWGGYALERYLGHSAKSVTDKHYVTPSEDEMQELFRTQVVARVEAALKRLGKKRQQNGKTRVSRPISASKSNSRRP
jgi:integrase